MTFFLDNNMPYKLAAVLQAMELEVVHLRDHYGRGDVPDEKWMPEIAALGWTALTYDRKIAVPSRGTVVRLATEREGEAAPRSMTSRSVRRRSAMGAAGS